MHDYQRILGERVRKEKKNRGLTQSQLAAIVSSNKRTILDIENGQGNPKLETLFAILSTLNIDPYPIFFPDPPERSEALTQLLQIMRDFSEEEIKLMTSVVLATMEFSKASNQVNAL